MENFFGWILIIGVALGLAAGIFYTVRAFRRYLAEEKAAQEKSKRDREAALEQWKAQYTNPTYTGRTTKDFITDTNRISVTDNKTGRTTYAHHTNDGPDLLTSMIIMDMINNHKEVSAGTVKWDNDTPSVTETYNRPSPSSFGLDDSDSRKSASDSFSSSDSSSSWGSSSDSSSSSGPSSDW